MKKDYFGNELKIGDEVAFVPPYVESKTFKTGVIVEFTKKMVRIEYKKGSDMYPRSVLKMSEGLILKK